MSKNDTYVASTQEQRVEHWISQLEAQTQLLLNDIDIEEISHRERLNLALKMMSQLQHFLALQQKTSGSQPASNHVNAVLDNLMRQMRGEDDESVAAIPLVCEAEEVEAADEDVDGESLGW